MNGHIPGNLPVLDGKNWSKWNVQMRALFGFQDVYEVIQNGVEEPKATTSDAQRQALKDLKKNDCKTLFFLHQCVDSAHLEKIATATTLKEAWDILAKACFGNDKLKKVKLNTLKRQYELLQMEDNERVYDYFTRLLRIVNQMQECGEKFKDQDLVEKVMRT